MNQKPGPTDMSAGWVMTPHGKSLMCLCALLNGQGRLSTLCSRQCTELASVPKTKSAKNLPTFTPFLGGSVVTSGKSWTRCAEACQARGRATFSHHDERVSRSVFSRPVIHDRCQTTGVGVTLCAEIRHFLVFAWSFSKRMRQRQCCSPQVGQANRNASEMCVSCMNQSQSGPWCVATRCSPSYS